MLYGNITFTNVKIILFSGYPHLFGWMYMFQLNEAEGFKMGFFAVQIWHVFLSFMEIDVNNFQVNQELLQLRKKKSQLILNIV